MRIRWSVKRSNLQAQVFFKNLLGYFWGKKCRVTTGVKSAELLLFSSNFHSITIYQQNDIGIHYELGVRGLGNAVCKWRARFRIHYELGVRGLLNMVRLAPRKFRIHYKLGVRGLKLRKTNLLYTFRIHYELGVRGLMKQKLEIEARFRIHYKLGVRGL